MRLKKHETTGEEDLFRARLDQIIRMKRGTGIGAVISVSAPFPPPINIRCRGTRDGGNTGGDTNDTNSTLSDIGPIRRACIVIALVAFTPPRKCCRSEGMTTQKFYPRNDIRTFR